jgi:hypothetical protein
MNDPKHSDQTLINGAAHDPSKAGAMQPDDLHDLFATPANFNPNDEEDPLAQLRNDPNYSALIRDLELIAKQARELFEPAAETPSDELWTKIQSQLPTKSNDA